MKKFNISVITTPYRAKLIISIYKSWFKRNGKALDVGCGTGIVANILKKELGLKITGCDVKNYLIHNIPFVKVKGDKLPFPKHSFDVVLFNDVLHHIDKPKQEQVISEALRVGKNVFIFEYEAGTGGKILDIVLNKFHYDDLNTPLAFRSANEWKQLFKKLSANYDYIKLKKPFWYPFTHIAFRVSKNK
ncbi:MAG: hypothetical protein G01um10147_36 [Microgenomates group bacterium Gr01-1014_7]|nr:MAG: hypothetical protein G01um10147_36 [Microgenomates group bacterium Gr01-1014_7]